MSFTIVDAKNPVWANDDKNAITLDVNFAEFTEDYVSFTASPTDNSEHGRDYGTVSEYVHHRLWHPIDQTTVNISEVGLVQILLEKGLLDDYDVDAILMENTDTVAFARTTTDPRMNGNWPNG